MSDAISDQPTLRQKLIAEAAGTALLVFVGCAAVVYPAARASSAALLSVAFAFGLALLLGLVTFGRISGGHFNPAVSAALAASGRISWRQAGTYAAAQVGGAVIGALVLWLTALGFPRYDTGTIGLGANAFGGNGASWWSALLVEDLLTAVFVIVILSVTDQRFGLKGLAPVAIALALLVLNLIAIPATGASFNPARSIGPALFSGWHAIGQAWLFVLAPLVGAVTGAGAYVALFGRDAEPVDGSGVPSLAEVRGLAAKKSVPEWQKPKETAEGAPPVYEAGGWRWDYTSQSWVPTDEAAETPASEPEGTTKVNLTDEA